jgi:hypothetical protein
MRDDDIAIDWSGKYPSGFVPPPGMSMAKYLRRHPELRDGNWLSTGELVALIKRDVNDPHALSAVRN